jgi:hypothetical protein
MYQVDDIELSDEVVSQVLHSEVKPLSESFGIHIVLQYQVVHISLNLRSTINTLKTAIRLADSYPASNTRSSSISIPRPSGNRTPRPPPTPRNKLAK